MAKSVLRRISDGEKLHVGSTHLNDDTNILEVEIPPQLEMRYSTSISWIDCMLGDGCTEKGVTPSSSIFFTGASGAGKSTLCAQIADGWTRAGGICLYNTQEESSFQIRKVVRRLNLREGFICGEDYNIVEVLKHAEVLRSKYPSRPLLLILDSLQTHDDGYYANGVTNGMTSLRIIRIVTSYCKTTFVPAIIIGQVNKNGVWAGKNQIKHLCDAHVHLMVDDNPDSPTFGKRLMRVEKNRFGRAGQGRLLGCNAGGLVDEGEYDVAAPV